MLFKYGYFKIIYCWAGLGIVVMGGDSCSEGCGFETQHHTFFT